MKRFTSKQIDSLKERFEFKKSAIKFTDPSVVLLPEKVEVEKGKNIYSNDEQAGLLKRTIVANTYLWLDTHDDVHMPGLFKRSIQHKGLRIPHLHDHIFQITAKVGKLESLEEKAISWRELGIGKTGKTEALIAVSEIKKDYNERIYNEYLQDNIDQHSVQMRYIELALAVNDEDMPNEYKVWQEVYPKLGNRAKADEQGFFFAIHEAALGEISAVLAGSNELTPTLKEGSLKDTPEPLQSTLTAKGLLAGINFKL